MFVFAMCIFLEILTRQLNFNSRLVNWFAITKTQGMENSAKGISRGKLLSTGFGTQLHLITTLQDYISVARFAFCWEAQIFAARLHCFFFLYPNFNARQSQAYELPT